MLPRVLAAMVASTLMLAPDMGAAGSAAEAADRRARACTADQGQSYIDEGRYDHAVREFTCVIQAQPTEVEGYRGLIEAELLLGRYSDAVRDYVRLMAFVLPVHPDAADTIDQGYDARLADSPDDVRALTGASFAHWWFFRYPAAIHLLNQLLDVAPNDVYGNLFRGSSRVLQGASRAEGAADLDRAIALAPLSADVRYIVADGYTYGSLADPARALDEAARALAWGLDTPRVRAILGSAWLAFGDLEAAAIHIQRHIDLVTTELLAAPALPAGDSLTLDLVPGRTWEIPVAVDAGETLAIVTSSRDFTDSILVLLAPDGSPVLGSDDASGYFAAFEWVADTAGTYRLQVTSFEAVNTGVLRVTRD